MLSSPGSCFGAHTEIKLIYNSAPAAWNHSGGEKSIFNNKLPPWARSSAANKRAKLPRVNWDNWSCHFKSISLRPRDEKRCWCVLMRLTCDVIFTPWWSFSLLHLWKRCDRWKTNKKPCKTRATSSCWKLQPPAAGLSQCAVRAQLSSIWSAHRSVFSLGGGLRLFPSHSVTRADLRVRHVSCMKDFLWCVCGAQRLFRVQRGCF